MEGREPSDRPQVDRTLEGRGKKIKIGKVQSRENQKWSKYSVTLNAKQRWKKRKIWHGGNTSDG